MATTNEQAPQDIQVYCQKIAEQAQKAGRQIRRLSGQKRTEVLQQIADQLEAGASDIVLANEKDLGQSEKYGLTSAMIDRLRLDTLRISKMAESVRQIAAQIDPVGQVIEGYVRPNGLQIQKVRVPIGVVLFIYESRPNVTSDAAALAIQSGNALILRGGKEALHSNQAIAKIVQNALKSCGLSEHIVQMINLTDRAVVGELLQLNEQIDVVIPRGGEGLIRSVVAQSLIPVIKHYTGNCHVYVDQHNAGDRAAAAVDICVNAKVQRPGVCNATETLLFHRGTEAIMKEAITKLIEAGVEVRADQAVRDTLAGEPISDQLIEANDDDWSTEYLDMIVAVKQVDSLDEAIDHINRYGSKHTDAVLTSDVEVADHFVASVDSANVMVNCSTRFSDGGEYGLGAEIGISTDKLHARGPMGATDLTTYQWVVRGTGQIRS